MNKHLISRIICLVLALASVLSISAFAISGAAEDLTSDTIVVDYSRPNSDISTVINSADLLKTLTGTSLSTVERDYLVKFGGITAQYDDAITSQSVVVSYDNDNRTLAVSANKYVYTSADGTEVVWVPEKATLLGASKALVSDGGAYKASFDNVPGDDESLAVNVSYTLEIVVAKDVANKLANLAYDATDAIKADMDKKNAEYQAALADYNAKKAVYDKYVNDLKDYNDYLDLKWEYDTAWVKYNEYLCDKAAYDAYQKYLEDLKPFKDYQDQIDAYNIAYNKYQTEYLKPIERCKRAIAILDYLYADVYSPALVSESNKKGTRVVYSDIKSSLATAAVAQEALLVDVLGVDPKVIENAATSTTVLRSLLDEYKKDFYDPKKSVEEKYNNFYIKNYAQLKDAFTKLFTSLYYLAQIDLVCAGINGIVDGKNRMPQFRHLVFSLYVICEALDDGTVKDFGGKAVNVNNLFIYGTSFKRAMSGVNYIKNSSNDSTPMSAGYPAYRAEPEKPQLPGGEYPSPVPKADEPTLVEEPKLAEPTKVDAPTRVEEPSQVEAPVFDSTLCALVDAVDSGSLTRRGEIFSEDQRFTVKSSVNKRFINVKIITVAFYDESGKFISSVEIDSNSYALFTGKKPSKPEDDRAVYRFTGWKNEKGEPVDITSVSESCNLYPRFSEEIKSYTVTWDVDGRISESSLRYGSVPVYPITPYKIPDGAMFYVFIGWDTDGDGDVDIDRLDTLPEVTRDVKYTAVFDMEMDVDVGDDSVKVIFDGKTFDYDATGSSAKEFDISKIYSLRDPQERETKVVIRTSYSKIEFGNETIVALEALNIHKISFRSISRADGSISFSISAKNGEGQGVICDASPIKVILNTGTVDQSRLRVIYTDADGKHNVIRHSYVDKSSDTSALLELANRTITFNATPGHTYKIASFYNVTFLTYEDTHYTVSTLSPGYFEGETVSINCTVDPGYSLDGFIVRDEAGNQLAMHGETFVMPKSDVTVIVSTTHLLYEIVFKNGDFTHETQMLHYGEVARIPVDTPTKESTDEFDYVFIGWDTNVDGIPDTDMPQVTGSATYTALFEEVERPADPPMEPDGGLNIWQILLIVFGSLLGVGAIVFVVILIVKRR